ncbi:keratin-associated protein 10-4-like [Liolophura sinensis]|uniref:keratin-associated protein 10-4-like n=1 Tax=Liolophura sinensis TaxID=3198878 RepID=UPI003158AB87
MNVIGAVLICGLLAVSMALPLDEKLDESPPVKPAVLPIELKPAEPCKATCRKMCEFGFLLDGTCPRCTCATNPCDTTICPENNVCITEPSDCGMDMCPHKASCKGTGVIMPEVLPIDIKPAEPCKATCRKMCEFGFLLDGTCPRCTCATNPCDTTICPENNVCITEPSDCGMDMCPHKASCKGTGVIMPEVLPIDIKPGKNGACEATARKACSFGFRTRGCPRSRCAPDPCQIGKQ